MKREKLINVGVDYDQGVQRFSGKANMYEEYLTKITQSNSMEKLNKEIMKKDYKNAYLTVQDIKDSAGNLSMNMLYNVMCEMTEELRDGNPTENLIPVYEYALSLYDAAVNVINEQ